MERAVHTARVRWPDLLAPGTRLVVGFSGGQDSTCLLHALHTHLRDLDLVAAHVDHGLRAESAADAESALALATQIGVRAHVTQLDVRAYQGKKSIQVAARAARYQALAAVVEQVGAAALMVAHTADDQAETVLLNLLRGSGLRGLGGMRPDEKIDPRRLGPRPNEISTVPAELRVARPLLRIDRATTLAYCAELGLNLVADPSNLSRAYTRNRVRLDVLPILERFNPAIRDVLARTAELVADDVAALDGLVADLHTRLAQPLSPDVVAYELAAWRAQPRALQRRLLRHALEGLVGTLEDVPAAPIEDALDLLRSSQPGQAYHLPYGVELVTRATTFELHLHGGARPRAPENTWGHDASRV